MEISESLFNGIAGTIKASLKSYLVRTESPVVTDIHILPLRDTEEIVVKDDDRELGRAFVPGLAEIGGDEFYGTMEQLLGEILVRLDSEFPLESLNIWKPFSFVMSDEDGDRYSDLMLFDDDNQLVSQTLMAGLDDDLSAFLKELMLD